jgi:glycosyltransferase involved in cell wall biosynthesis
MLRRRRPGISVAFDIYPDGEIARGIRRKHDVPYLLHLDAPRLLHARNEIQAAKETGRRFRRIIDDAEGIVTFSRVCRLEAYRLGVRPHNLDVVPPGVDVERFRPGPPPPELKKRLGAERGPVLLTVVDDVPSQDLETVFRAFAVVRGQRRGAVLVVVGEEEARSGRKLLRTLRIDRAVRFVGDVPADALPDYYRLASLYLGAHREDRDAWILQGVDAAFLEAMATGLPIAATRTPVIEELIPSDEVGVLVDPGAHNKLGKSAGDLLQSRERMESFARRARERAETRHDVRRSGASFRELLEVIYFRRLGRGTLEPLREPAPTESAGAVG